MYDLDDDKLKDFICNETSSFALSVIDVDTLEVIFTNTAMKNIMYTKESVKCYEAIYGQSSQCEWCKVSKILNLDADTIDESSSFFDNEYFNEITNSWYQVHNKVTKLDNGSKIVISVAVDISRQKEAQGDLISTQVKLVRQAQELEKTQKELKLLASTDSMTKLYNRRYFMNMSESLLDLAKRESTPTSIVMIDIDTFKLINDTYSHKIGDDTIMALSKLLQEKSRKSDIVCRWGGEEFIILLPNTSIEGSLIIAEKIRLAVENIRIRVDNSTELNFTISLGVSTVNNALDTSIEPAIQRADKALYNAKHLGKNQVSS